MVSDSEAILQLLRFLDQAYPRQRVPRETIEIYVERTLNAQAWLALADEFERAGRPHPPNPTKRLRRFSKPSEVCVSAGVLRAKSSCASRTHLIPLCGPAHR